MCTWERLFWDDASHINGIDVVNPVSEINAKQIIEFYDKDIRCHVTGEPVTTVMAADGEPSNFLYTNLIPMTDTVAERYSSHPICIVGKQFYYRDVTFSVHLETRFSLDDDPCATLSDAFLSPGLVNFHLSILPSGLPPRVELLALQCWQMLEKKAKVKGLARIKATLLDSGNEAYVTKQQVLRHTISMLQREISSRGAYVHAPDSRILVPNTVPISPERIIR